MQIPILSRAIKFPHPDDVNEPHGIVAVGGDLSVPRLTLAYSSGIFPWYNEDEPIIWWSPDPRFILYPDQLKVRRSLRKDLKKQPFEIRYDTAFPQVIHHCANQRGNGRSSTWITNDMIRAYIAFHHAGFAHSVETWLDGELVGGLYGVAIGPFFFGESMFHKVSNASKAALIALTQRFINAPFIDCQVSNDFFESMGGCHIPRAEYLDILAAHIHEPNTWEQTK